MPLWSRVSVFVAVIVLGSSMTIANTSKSNISSDTSKKAAPITKSVFGKTQDGVAIELYTLHNASGASAKVMTFGATLVDLDMPDRNGKMGDVVLGFDNLQQYLGKTPFFGVTVARYPNLIAKHHFTLNATTSHFSH